MPVHVRPERLLWVKLRNTRSEQIFSALPPITDVHGGRRARLSSGRSALPAPEQTRFSISLPVGNWMISTRARDRPLCASSGHWRPRQLMRPTGWKPAVDQQGQPRGFPGGGGHSRSALGRATDGSTCNGSVWRRCQAACFSAGLTSKPTRGKRKFTLPTEGSSCRTIISSGAQARMLP